MFAPALITSRVIDCLLLSPQVTKLRDQKTPRGRPRQHATPAARQAAYRQRLAERGLRVVQRLAPTRSPALRSAVIDLSAAGRPPRERVRLHEAD
jgi:hypothetical protein